MTDTAFCYHCRRHHPIAEMRQVASKMGKRWRCIRSIEAAKSDRATREAFGQAVSELNRAEAAAKARIANGARQDKPR